MTKIAPAIHYTPFYCFQAVVQDMTVLESEVHVCIT